MVIQKLMNFLEQQSQRTLVAFAVLITVLLGVFDLQTGVEIHFLLLYLVPIFVTSWFVSREVGVYLALLATLIWFAADSLGAKRVGDLNFAIEKEFRIAGIEIPFPQRDLHIRTGVLKAESTGL